MATFLTPAERSISGARGAGCFGPGDGSHCGLHGVEALETPRRPAEDMVKTVLVDPILVGIGEFTAHCWALF